MHRLFQLMFMLSLLSGCTFLKTPEIKGTVVDSETGAPIKGAWIYADWQIFVGGPGGPASQSPGQATKVVKLRSGPDGKFIIPSHLAINYWPFPIGDGCLFEFTVIAIGYDPVHFFTGQQSGVPESSNYKDISIGKNDVIKVTSIRDPKIWVDHYSTATIHFTDYKDDEEFCREEDKAFTDRFGNKKWDKESQRVIFYTYLRLKDFKNASRIGREIIAEFPEEKNTVIDAFKWFKGKFYEKDNPAFNLFMETNYTNDLGARTKADIYKRRQMEIDKYGELEIYPTHYIPNKSLFGQINDRIGWVNETPLFLINPYLLVIETGGECVNGIFPYCPVSSLVYSQKRITISYENKSAKKWLHYINEYYPESKGILRLWFVNAMDAGFPYAHIDASRSVNVDPVPGAAADQVMKGIYTPNEFFHVGHKGKNNISPNDARAKLKLKVPDAKTTIYIKLWRKKPVSADAPEDFAYVIEVDPRS